MADQQKASDPVVPSPPPLHLLYRSKTGLRGIKGPPDNTHDPTGILVDGEIGYSYKYGRDGDIVAVNNNNSIIIYKTSTGEEISNIPQAGVVIMELSPLGTYLVTWSYAKKKVFAEGEEKKEHEVFLDNLFIWNLKTREVVKSWLQKKQTWPAIHFTQDEDLAARVIAGSEIHFFTKGNFDSFQKFPKPGVSQLYFSSLAGLTYQFILTVPERASSPAFVNIYSFPTLSIVSQASFQRAQEIEIKWNSTGTAALVISRTETDSSGKSYYGETGLYIIRSDGTSDNLANYLAKGNIYDCNWDPSGKHFIVVHGKIPPKVSIFNLKLELLVEFPQTHKNTALFSPNGHMVLIGGFGNLQGQTDIWDWNRARKIGSMVAACSSIVEWSPCSNYILTATLSPKLRVDNGWKIWNVDGSLHSENKINDLYQISWKPTPPSLYPNRKPKRNDVVVKQVEAPKPVAKYRHPHFSASNSAPEQPKAEDIVVAKKFNPDKQKREDAKLPPGSKPLSKAALKNKKKREKKKLNEQNPVAINITEPTLVDSTDNANKEKAAVSNEEKVTPSNANNANKNSNDNANKPSPNNNNAKRNPNANNNNAKRNNNNNANNNANINNSNANNNNSISPEEKEEVLKKIKAVNKKLRQIEQMKEQQKQGKVLNDQQKDKISKEKELLSEKQNLQSYLPKQ